MFPTLVPNFFPVFFCEVSKVFFTFSVGVKKTSHGHGRGRRADGQQRLLQPRRHSPLSPSPVVQVDAWVSMSPS